MQDDKLATRLATDPVAAAVEGHLREMEAAGYGNVSISREGDEIVLAFGRIKVRGETIDVGLLRLACAVLDSNDHCYLFLALMRDAARNPPAVNSRDSSLGVRQGAGRR